MATVTLTHEDINSGNPVTVLCNNIVIGGKKNVISTPDANGDGIVEAQTQSIENFTYVLSGINYTGAANTLTWDNVITLYKSKYDGTNYITLNVTYGSTGLKGLEESTDIKVVVESLSLPISTVDTRNAYIPVGTITLRETK